MGLWTEPPSAPPAALGGIQEVLLGLWAGGRRHLGSYHQGWGQRAGAILGARGSSPLPRAGSAGHGELHHGQRGFPVSGHHPHIPCSGWLPLTCPHVPGGLPRPGALHLCGPHRRADGGTFPQRGRGLHLGAGQGCPGCLHQEEGLVSDRAGTAVPAEGLHDTHAAGRRLLLLLLPLVRERAGLQAGGDRGSCSLRRLCSHRDAGRGLLQEAAALLQQEPPGRGGEVLRAADAAPGRDPRRACDPAGLRPGPAALGAVPHPPALSHAGWQRASPQGRLLALSLGWLQWAPRSTHLARPCSPPGPAGRPAPASILPSAPCLLKPTLQWLGAPPDLPPELPGAEAVGRVWPG
ncbi:hypothetical protein KIL84_003929 [Mauremys mutica]|uniref:Uncharacterized protein n=1 Tax=Mauremys mutica TaxID=74926 RepID=A0A9D3WWJ5_9SAUR|nr:hypothetical protein KIL84_003929 [Mauremys mutica]